MIKIYESNGVPELTEQVITDVFKLHGFKQVSSSDAFIYNYTKIEPLLNNAKVDLTVYFDDSNDTCSISVTTPDIDDFAYLSDYFSTRNEIIKWINNDYYVAINEMKERKDTE